MSKFQHYLSMVVFTLGFVLGIQVPNFIDQYVKRVDAHSQEASSHLKGYQAIADLNQNGDLKALIQKHAESSDPTFREETQVIENLLAKQQRYQAEKQAMSQGWLPRIRHIVFASDREILHQTYLQYSPGVPLNLEAVAAGFSVALLLCLCLELLIALLRLLVGGRRRRHLFRDAHPH